MMSISLLMRLLVLSVSAISLASLVYVYAFPPPSLQMTRDGVPFFTPPVENPEGGEPLELGELIRHFQGAE